MNAINHSEISVTILDGFSIFRAGLRRVLEAEPDLRVQFETGDLHAMLDATRTHSPHVILVGANLRGSDCAQAIHTLSAHARNSAVILLAPHLDAECQRTAIRAGAFAVLAGDASAADLIATIRRAARITPTRPVTAPLRTRTLLSTREREVLQYATYGKSNKEIAYLLKLKEKTVTNYMTSILRKMCATNRTQAVVQGLQQGWLAA